MSAENKIMLYDSQSSPNCQRVKVVLEEKRLPYGIIPVDLKKMEQKRPEFLKLNPYGKVPVIADVATVLYESCIINEYLEEKYPEPSLLPRDAAKRAKIRILIDYGMNHFDPHYMNLRRELSKDESARDSAALETARRELKHLLLRFEREIGAEPYLAGEFSLVDADLIPRFLRMEAMAVLPDPSLPRLGAWLKRMKERPSVKAIL